MCHGLGATSGGMMVAELAVGAKFCICRLTVWKSVALSVYTYNKLSLNMFSIS